MEQRNEDHEYEHEHSYCDRNADEEPPFRQWWTGLAHLSSDRYVARGHAWA
jgi:hypothetical protein